jgi:phage gpG-like protein
VSGHLDGVNELQGALSEWRARVRAATNAGVDEGASEMRSAIQDNLARSVWPPVSEPGEPPAYRTGELSESVVVSEASETDTGAEVQIYPSTVYARIQELSGWAGKDHKSFLPKRPYVQPALDEVAPHFGDIMSRRWQDAAP